MNKDELIKELESNGVKVKDSEYELVLCFPNESFISVHYGGISLKTKDVSYLFNSDEFFKSLFTMEKYKEDIIIAFHYHGDKYTFSYEFPLEEKNSDTYESNIFNNLFTHIRVKSYQIRKKIEKNEIIF